MAQTDSETGSVAGENDVVSGVGGRYASALFDLADEAGLTDRVLSQLDTVVAALDQSPDFARFVRSPVFTSEDQAKGLDALLPTMGVTGVAANTLRLMAKNRRLFLIKDVAKAYRQLVAARRGATTAEVTSAEPLSAAQTAALEAALKSATGKTVALNHTVDPSLIGGLVVKLGSKMIDTSLKTKLSQLKIALKEVR